MVVTTRVAGRPFELKTAFARKTWAGAGLIALVFGMLAQLASMVADRDDWWMHAAWCVAGLCLVLPMLFRAIKRGFTLVLQDHLVMFMAAFALYFLIGALFLPYGQQDHIDRVQAYYAVDAVLALRADAINAFGFGVALMTAAIVPRRLFARHADRVARAASRVPSALVMLLLMLFSALALSQTLAVDFGFVDGIVVGIWRTAARFSTVAIFLGAMYRGQYERWMRSAAVVLAVVSALAGILLFTKTGVLIALGALIAGLAVRYTARRILPAGLFLLVVLYLSIGSIVAYGRSEIPLGTPGSLAERWDVVRAGIGMKISGNERYETSPWGRLCYLPAQAAGIEFYDRGMPDDEMKLIPWVFVPRAIAPSKPVITQSGKNLHYRISGSKSSQTGQGVFTSGYFNAGWLGVLFAGIVCGGLLAQTSAIAAAVFQRRAMLLLPLALMGFHMAFRIDGSFVADYLGAFVFVLYPLIAASILIAIAKKPRAQIPSAHRD